MTNNIVMFKKFLYKPKLDINIVQTHNAITIFDV